MVVNTPCPISATGAAIRMELSVPMVTHPPMVWATLPDCANASGRSPRNPPMAKVKVSPAPPLTKPRRDNFNSCLVMTYASFAARSIARTIRG